MSPESRPSTGSTGLWDLLLWRRSDRAAIPGGHPLHPRFSSRFSAAIDLRDAGHNGTFPAFQLHPHPYCYCFEPNTLSSYACHPPAEPRTLR